MLSVLQQLKNRMEKEYLVILDSDDISYLEQIKTEKDLTNYTDDGSGKMCALAYDAAIALGLTREQASVVAGDPPEIAPPPVQSAESNPYKIVSQDEVCKMLGITSAQYNEACLFFHYQANGVKYHRFGNLEKIRQIVECHFGDGHEFELLNSYSDLRELKCTKCPKTKWENIPAEASRIALTPKKAEVPERWQEMVLLETAPYEGDMVKDSYYGWGVCTGTSKSWYCHDNSHGDSSLEGSYVCYAYYVPATNEQIEAHLTAVDEERRTKNRIAELSNLLKSGKIADEKPEYKTIWSHPQPSATIQELGITVDGDAVFCEGQQPYLIDVMPYCNYHIARGGSHMAEELAELLNKTRKKMI